MSDDFSAFFNFLQDTHLIPADVGFVFGNKYISKELASRAAELYREGFFRKGIVVTGGVRGITDLEAHELYKHLTDEGLPGDFILVENKSMNTAENVKYGRELLRDKIGLENIDTILALGHAYGGRRFIMTMAKLIPHALPMYSGVYPAHVAPYSSDTDDEFRERVLLEMSKIPHYLRLNYITDITVEDVNKRILERFPDQEPRKPFTMLGQDCDRKPL